MDYSIIKALHIVFVITWFAGLFYIVRLFVYHAEAHFNSDFNSEQKDTLINQYKIMQRRLWYGITWPSMILTTTFGVLMFVENPYLLQTPWMHFKIGFLIVLIAYHFSIQLFFKRLQKNHIHSSTFFRYWNEVATVLLIAIVFLAVTKNVHNWWQGLIGLVAFSLLLMIAIKIYKSIREK